MTPIDVVVPVYRDVALTAACLEAVLAASGPRLGRLIVVDDRGPEPEMGAMLREIRNRDPRVRLLVNEENLGFVRACNRGLAIREGDVAVLNADARVTPGWLDELAAGLEQPRVAAVCPLSNNATLCSVPRWGEPAEEAALAGGLHTEHLERFTEMPTGVGFCMLLRGEVLSCLGSFDPAWGRGYNEENDWCQRARAAGYKVLRANRALVYHRGEVSFAGERAARDVLNARRLVSRYPNYLAENAAFARSIEAHAPAIQERVVRAPVRVTLVDWLDARLEPAYALAVERLRAELAADPNVTLIPWAGRGTVDVVHVLGTPCEPREVAELLRREAHLVHSHFDPVVLEGRPLGLRWEELEARRAATWLLWAPATVVVPDEETASAVRAFAHDVRVVLEPWGAVQPAEPGAGEIVALSPHFTPHELALLLEVVEGESLVLDARVGLQGLRPGVRLVDGGVPSVRAQALGRARVLVVPMAEGPGGPDVDHARQLGIPVVPVDRDLRRRLRADPGVQPRREPVQASRWSRRYREESAVAPRSRRRVLEVVDALTRLGSSGKPR